MSDFCWLVTTYKPLLKARERYRRLSYLVVETLPNRSSYAVDSTVSGRRARRPRVIVDIYTREDAGSSLIITSRTSCSVELLSSGDNVGWQFLAATIPERDGVLRIT